LSNETLPEPAFRPVNPRHPSLAKYLCIQMPSVHGLTVEAKVDEYDIAGIAPSAQATIAAEGYASAGWRGQVEEVPEYVAGRQTRPDDPGRPTDTRVLRVKVAFQEPNPLKLGQHVEVEIARGGKNP
jgi:HlyD family secretion protein